MSIYGSLFKLHICRKKSSNPIEIDFDVTTNVSYKEVSLKAKERVRDYMYEDVEVNLEPCNRSTEGDKPRARSIKLKSEASE